MKQILFVFVLASLLLVGCVQPQSNGNGGDISMELIEAGDTVKVEYRGELENGEVFDASERHGQPLEFVAGAGQMIAGFDEAVVGMRLNEEKTVTIPPEKAYGFRSEQRVAEIPKENFGDSWDSLKEGMPVSSPESGNGIIVEKKENSAKVDFNHQLAGKTLVFWIKVVSVEKVG